MKCLHLRCRGADIPITPGATKLNLIEKLGILKHVQHQTPGLTSLKSALQKEREKEHRERTREGTLLKLRSFERTEYFLSTIDARTSLKLTVSIADR